MFLISKVDLEREMVLVNEEGDDLRYLLTSLPCFNISVVSELDFHELSRAELGIYQAEPSRAGHFLETSRFELDFCLPN